MLPKETEQETSEMSSATEAPETLETPEPLETSATLEASGPLDAAALEEGIVDALKTVYDPEIPVNIYELGS